MIPKIISEFKISQLIYWSINTLLRHSHTLQRHFINNYKEVSSYGEVSYQKSKVQLKTRLKRISIYKRERLIEIMDNQNQVTRRTFSMILQ